MHIRNQQALLGIALSLGAAPAAYAECDPSSWQTVPTVSPGQTLSAVAYGLGQYVAAGADQELLVSIDGLTWTDADPTQGTVSYLDVEFGNGIFVASGTEGRVDVLNGPNAGGTTFGDSALIAAMAYGNGTWVGVGGVFDLALGWSEVIVFSKDNGASWDVALVEPVPNALSVTTDVAFQSGRFIAVAGDGGVRGSLNGEDWSSPTQIASDLKCIAGGGGVFVAAGESGNIRRSLDGGLSWANEDFGGNAWFGAAYGKGIFTLVGQNGSIASSSNAGASWTSRASGATQALEAIGYGEPGWISVGSSNPGAQVILASICQAPLANLQAFAPAGWDGAITVATVPGTTMTKSDLTDDDMIYVDAAWANSGQGDAGTFDVEIHLTGGAPFVVNAGPIASGGAQAVNDLAVGPLPPGMYTVSVTLDSLDEIEETDEGDNVAELTFSIRAGCPADLDDNQDVGAGDLAILLAGWGADGASDLDGDGETGSGDLAVLLAAWGPCPA